MNVEYSIFNVEVNTSFLKYFTSVLEIHYSTFNICQVKLNLILICLLLIVSTPLSLWSQSGLERKYKAGEHYRYRLTTQVLHNGAWQSTTISVCELQVVADSNNIPYDEVHWISKKVITAKDTTDRTAEAIQVKPYRISLHPKGQMNIPKIDVADMTGEITDFNTFLVAISPKLGIAGLKKKGDVYVQKEMLKGDFSNGKDILKGNDCLAVRVTLTDANKDNAWLESSFLPPADTCLHFLTPDMNTPVAPDTLNNFQMVKPFNNRYNVLYGKEYFTINSTVQKKDGKLKEATMVNKLSLKIKLFCDDQYSNCQSTMPFSIVRNLKVELIQ